jgi:hypothetical protein
MFKQIYKKKRNTNVGVSFFLAPIEVESPQPNIASAEFGEDLKRIAGLAPEKIT